MVTRAPGEGGRVSVVTSAPGERGRVSVVTIAPSSSSSLPRSLHSGAQHQSVGAAVRPIALIKSSTITGSLFKIPSPGLPPRWICLSPSATTLDYSPWRGGRVSVVTRAPGEGGSVSVVTRAPGEGVVLVW